MSFFRKLFSRQAPEWAHFFSAAEFDAFQKALEAELRARGVTYRLDAKEGVVQVAASPKYRSQALGLLNLAQVCRGSSPEGWPEIIGKHLGIVLADTSRVVDELEVLAGDFERARELIKVRLQPASYVSKLEGAVAAQPVADDLIAVLVYDFPESIAGVHPDHVEKWGVPLHDLVQLGLRNVWSMGKLPGERVDLGEDVWFNLYADPDNYFAASHALLLHEYLNPEPELGSLVGVPHRHAVIVRPLDGPGALRALGAVLHAVPGLYEQGPGSVVPHVYWHRHGVFTRLPFERKGQEIAFQPPDAFVEQVLNKLQ